MSVITEVYRLTATTSDILKAPSRLSAIPFDGELTIEVSATDCDASNNATLTVQLPSGEVPMDDQEIPASWGDGTSTAAMLHDDTETVLIFDASQGGHFNLSTTVTGTCTLLVRATLSDAA